MKIETIRLENYRQYQNQEIDFPLGDNEKHFIIIQGENGTGKTNILNAIYWCLYGEEVDIGDKNKGKPIINDITINSSDEGEEITVKVVIVMRDDENKRVVFTRTKKFEKCSSSTSMCKPVFDGSENSQEGTRFDIAQEKERHKYEYIGEPDDIISRVFPKEISRYFLFNGETLDKYFREPANIRKEVFNISQLEILEIVINHLTARVKEMAREYKHTNPEVAKFLELVEKGKEELNKNENKLENLITEREKASSIIRDLQEKLKNSSSEQIKRMEEEREQLKKETEEIEKDKRYDEQERFRYFIDMMPKLMAYEAVYETNKMIKEKRDRKEIPPLVSPEFIQEILKKGRCICGRDISKKTDAQNRIRRLLDTFNINRRLTTEIMNVEQKLKEINSSVKDFKDKQMEYSSSIKNLQEQINQRHNRLEKISRQIGSSDIEEIRQLERLFKEAENGKEKILDDIAKIRLDNEELRKNINAYEEQYKKELKKSKKNERLKNKLLFCQEAQGLMENLKEKIMEEIRSLVQESTEEQFFKLNWKKRSYSSTDIDEDYNISVKDMSGGESVGTLSAGERQILALSFMAALNIVSGFKFPIVIDTPLARLSKEHKANIAKNLPNYLKGRQVIILATGEEYTKEVKALIKDSVCQEYTIKFHENKLGSEAEVKPNA